MEDGYFVKETFLKNFDTNKLKLNTIYNSKLCTVTLFNTLVTFTQYNTMQYINVLNVFANAYFMNNVLDGV